MRMQRPEKVAVVAFDGISPFHLSVPCLVFGEDRTDRGDRRYEVIVCSSGRAPLRTNAGFTVQTAQGLDALRRADLVIVPSWPDAAAPVPKALSDALRAAHRRGAKIVGLCLGAFVLAEAGLLRGRSATTHWYVAGEFARRYPGVEVQPEVLYVDEGDVVTSAGTAAAIDCCLHLLRVRHGAEAANRAARRMVVAPHRAGGQAQYIEQPVPAAPQRDRLTPLIEWLRQHLQEPHGLDELAQRACMSRRNFTRRFRELTGTSVGAWLQDQRLALAQRLLETTSSSMEEVALACGIGSAISLRQQFRAKYDLSPTQYRRQFAGRS